MQPHAAPTMKVNINMHMAYYLVNTGAKFRFGTKPAAQVAAPLHAAFVAGLCMQVPA